MTLWRRCRWSLVILLAACWDSPTLATYQGGDFQETMTIGTWDRTFRVHVPARATVGPVAPLILAFHGSGQTAEQFENQIGLDAAADAAGAIVVYPDAAMGAWDANDELVEILGINDMLFVRRLIDHVASEYVVDRDRIVAVGLSNGAVFSQRLGCEMADQVAGFVSVAGTLPRPLRDGCHPTRPVGAFYIVGSTDRYFPVGGDDVVLAVDSTMSFWAGQAHCAGRTTRVALPDTAGDDTHVFRSHFLGCSDDRAVGLDSIAGSGHGWPGALRTSAGISHNISANQEIVQFVMAGRSRPR